MSIKSMLTKLPLSPLATGIALFLLTRAPPAIRSSVHEILGRLVTATRIDQLVTALKWLFALGLVRNFNALLNELAANNFYLRSSVKDWSWPNEIAVITGASSGFGKLFSQDLIKQGIRVVGLDINPPPSDLSDNARFTFVKCDVTVPDQVNEAARHIQDTVGHPSILINNAGIAQNHTVMLTPPDKLRKITNVNLLSHYYTIQAFVPHMIEHNKGHVVSIASMASFVAAPGMVDYCITKAGLVTLHKGLGAELRAVHKAPKIKLSIVHPTFARTNLILPYEADLVKAGATILDPQTVSDAVVKQILSGRSGRIILTELPGPMVSLISSAPSWLYWLGSRVTEGAMAKKL